MTLNELKSEIKEGNVIVDFFANWCGPCKMMMPVLDDIEKTENIKVIKINVDENPEITSEFNIRSVPTFFFYKEGNEVARTVGTFNKATLKTIF